MKTMQKFKALHNKEVSRHLLKQLVAEAKKENNTEIVYRVSKILNNNPNHKTFNITVRQYPTALNAPRHQGAYKDALSECGRLKKGYKFIKGRVIKAAAKVPKLKRKGLAGRKSKEGLTPTGRLKKGYKYAKNGKIVKVTSKKKAV